jgi:hypothetical protein
MKKALTILKSAAGKVSLATLAAGASATVALADFNASDVEPITPSRQNLPTIITTVVNFALAIVGIIAVVYLIWGGVTYITAGGDAEKAGKGRTTITNAIIGIVIIIAALAIYNGVLEGAVSGGLQ